MLADDIETARSYVARHFGMSVAQLNEGLELPDEFEYFNWHSSGVVFMPLIFVFGS